MAIEIFLLMNKLFLHIIHKSGYEIILSHNIEFKNVVNKNFIINRIG
jgi:hypothetical protein